jgi:hypothetical protein
LTEDNAQLLGASDPPPGEAQGAAVRTARERLASLRPSYVRLLVDWAALQPDARVAPALEGAVSGCAREIQPCAGYRGIAAELAAIAASQRAARADGRSGWQVMLDVFGVPTWAARAPSGCELPGARGFARAITPAGLAGYRALIRALLALGAREGVELSWWSPWNEPNNPQFLSPQRESCAAGAPSLAPAVYAQLAEAMADELTAAGGAHHLLLGELAAYAAGSPHRTSVAEFIAGLPSAVGCLSADWSIHAYAGYGEGAPSVDPVATLRDALAADGDRAACGRTPRIWVTETGVGAPRPGRGAVPDAAAERAGCLALGAQLVRWTLDPSVEAVFQYTFRDDPAFPVGLISADLMRVHPAYELWLHYTRARERDEATPSPAALCA